MRSKTTMTASSLSCTNDEDEQIRLQRFIDRIKAMCQQEDTHYSIMSIGSSARTDRHDLSKSDKHRAIMSDVLEWRSKMILYCYQIVDFANLSRESVIVAIEYLDRFLWGTTVTRTQSKRVKQARISAMRNGKTFQLIAITCLYVAIKLNELVPFDIDCISKLTHNTYSPVQIEAMESVLLDGLRWYMNPPTTASFINELCNLITSSKIRNLEADNSMMFTFHELTTRQVEFAAMNAELIGVKSSWIAYCAVLNALKVECIPNHQIIQIENLLHQVLALDDNAFHNQHLCLPQEQYHYQIPQQQSIFVMNSRIVIREITTATSCTVGQPHIIDEKYDEIDVVLRDNEDDDGSVHDVNCCNASSPLSPTSHFIGKVSENNAYSMIMNCISSDSTDDMKTSNKASTSNSTRMSLLDVQDCLYDRIALGKGVRQKQQQRQHLHKQQQQRPPVKSFIFQ